MIRHKICMLGAFAVGKTSLVRRFVHSIFDERYQTTIGVQIEKRSLDTAETPMDLMIWDIAGDDDFFKVPKSFISGAAGYLLVIDSTRRATLDVARDLHERAKEEVGDVPVLVLVNKSDLEEENDLSEPVTIGDLGSDVVRPTSALTGVGVAEAFDDLARRIEATRGRTM